MPKLIKEDFDREGLFELLSGKDNFGIELGVAYGYFSKVALASNKFKLFIGIDSYDMGKYSAEEYIKAIKNINIVNNINYHLLKLRFNDALNLIENNSLDFIYFDGFAHDGQLGGKTIIDWFPKVKVGGIIAGDDYSSDWPLLLDVINDFADKVNADLHITKISKKNEYSNYPSWFFIKLNNYTPNINPNLYRKSLIRGNLEFFYNFKSTFIKFLKLLIVKFLNKKIINIIKRK